MVQEVWVYLVCWEAEIKNDKNIPDFLESTEKDGCYHLYVIHGGMIEVKNRNRKLRTNLKGKRMM